MCQPCLPLFLSPPLSLPALPPLSLVYLILFPFPCFHLQLAPFSFFFFFFSWFPHRCLFVLPAVSFSSLSVSLRFHLSKYLCSVFLSLSLFLCFCISSLTTFLSLIVFCLSLSTFTCIPERKKRGRNQVTEIGQHIGGSPSYIKVLDRSISVCRWSWHHLLERC